MKRCLAALVVVALMMTLSGCAFNSSGEADIQLTSIGQSPTEAGDAVEVVGVIENRGDATTNVTATVQILNGEETVDERTLSLGELGPDESVQFSTTFDVDPSTVDGQRVTIG